MIRADRVSSPCCKAALLWEQFQRMRLYRMVGQKKVYSAICSRCRKSYEAKP